MSDKQEIERLKSRLKTYEQEISRQQVRIAELETLLGHLDKQLALQLSAKQHAKDLYLSIDTAIMKAIDKRGYTRRQAIKLKQLPDIKAPAGSEEHMIAVWAHDAEAYFQLRGLKEGMKLRYRVAGKFYRVTRDVSKTGAKKMYKTYKRGRTS
jgi:hypothetical protein